MAGPNTTPIFPLTPKVSFGKVTAANTAKDGTGTVVTVATGGTNGTKIDQILIRALGSNVATVMRFFINNGSDSTIATNNTLVHEVTCAATTLSETAALTGLDVAIPADDGAYKVPVPYLPAGYKLNIAIGTAVSAGLQVTVFGVDY